MCQTEAMTEIPELLKNRIIEDSLRYYHFISELKYFSLTKTNFLLKI